MDRCVSANEGLENRFNAQRILGTGRPGSAAKKVCIYSHDTFGLGHLRRNLAIADQLLRSEEHFEVWLLTGSPVIRRWALPSGLHVQPLPPVVKIGADHYAARFPGQMFGLTKGYREALIMKLIQEQRPDVFLVDHSPAGMNGELLSTLALIRNQLSETRAVLGLRDILDSPASVRRSWESQEIHKLIEHAYDEVFVYGSENLFDVVAGYGLTSPVAQRVKYCGYVVGRARLEKLQGTPTDEVCWDRKRVGDRPVVLVTGGGGGDGHFLMRAYLEGLCTGRTNEFHTVIVTGPLMPPEQRAALKAVAAARDDVQIVAYTTDLLPSILGAELVVSMAGYNTSVELLAARKKAILVPRHAPREEQKLRAEILERLGLFTAVSAGDNLAPALALEVPRALGATAPPPHRWHSVDLQGAERICAEFAGLRLRRESQIQGAA